MSIVFLDDGILIYQKYLFLIAHIKCNLRVFLHCIESNHECNGWMV